MGKIIITLLTAACISIGMYAADKNISQRPPLWVDSPTSAYPETEYLTAVETGASRKEAEVNAVEALAAIFNRNISSETQTAINYTNEQREQQTKIDKKKTLNKKTAVSTAIKDLKGVEIKEVWTAGDGVYYALAVLSRSQGTAVYKNKITENNKAIAEMLAISDHERGTIVELLRNNSAYKKAQESAAYFSYLSILNPSAAAMVKDQLPNPQSLKLKCTTIAKNIPILLSVEGDQRGRLKTAFGKALSSEGLAASTTQAKRYELRAILSIFNEDMPNNKKIILRYVLDVEFIDSNSNEVLMPYSVSGREIHLTKISAETRIFSALEKKIQTEFIEAFKNYLNQFI